MTNREAFRKNLHRLISQRECTQTDIAYYIPVAKATVSAWMNGGSYPKPDTMEKLAKFFGVSVFELVCGENTDEEQLLRYFRVLSNDGKKKALNNMYELSKNYWYGKA